MTLSPELFMIDLVGLMAVATIAKFFLGIRIDHNIYTPVMAWFFFFLVVEGAISKGYITSVLLPAPTDVIWKTQYYLEKGILQYNATASIARFLKGFIYAIITAVLLGIIFSQSDRLYSWFSPVINFLRVIPPPAILPFAIIALGIGEAPGIFVITLGCFFPIFFATIRGINETEKIHKEAVQTLGGGKLAILIHAGFPSAIPSIMSGIRVGFGIGWLVLVSAEAISTDRGLGFIVQGKVDTAMVFMGIATICLFGMILDFGLKKLERRFTRKKRGGSDYIYY